MASCNAEEKKRAAEEEAKERRLTALREKELDFEGGLPAIVYKTRQDYSKNVAVMLSADKSYVQGFPQPASLFASSLPTYPTSLSGGYMLDHVGITPTVAFLDLTYLDYSRLPQAPDLDQLKARIIDQDPLTEMYDCGNRFQYQDLEADLNTMIENGLLSKCRKIK